jgi:alpha-galactosidase
MPVSGRKMDRILVNVLGFERRMGRHQIYILRIGGKQVARTLISHGVREIGDDLMAMMARQMGITLFQLKKIIAGKMGREEYYRLLKEQGRIE